MKRLLLSLFLTSFISVLFAANVELQDAKTIAKNAYFQKINSYLEEIEYDALVILDYYVINSDNESVIYAFDFENYGFILIAADDAIEPVLGYSFDNHYTSENQSQGFKGVLWEYGTHITYLRTNKIEASPEISQQWNELASFKPSVFTPKDGSKDIEPLLTVTWDQSWPYNYYCPIRTTQPNSNGQALVGCVATAMSQIMLYWRYPHQGTGSHTYYCYPFGSQTANFGATTYDWDAMQDNISQINLAAGIIGYHAGVSVDMDYNSPGGSGAFSEDVAYALKTYFNYSNSVMWQQRFNPLSTWEGILQDQLEDNCPVYYSGQSPDGGHAFVVDGYHESDGKYHFNFGWGGSGNGWFLITDAGGFTTYQAMVRNIIPADVDYPYGCNPDFELTNMRGSFEDGSGPQEDYDQSASCSWLINPQTEHDSVRKIKISFVTLDTDDADVVTVYDGSSTSDPVLGEFFGSIVPNDFFSTGNQVLIVFEADGNSSTGTGFKIEYNSVLPEYCPGSTVFTEPSGSFEDGSGNFYYNNPTTCLYIIEPEDAFSITLSFTEFHTEEGVDLVRVRDGNNTILAEISGDYSQGSLPEPIYSEDGSLIITFQTDAINNFPGWVAEWDMTTGIDTENVNFSSLSVYPNPTSNLLNVSFELEDTQAFEVKLISVTGKVVYHESKENFSGHYVNTIDLSNMSKGVYFLNLSNETGAVNKKVIVK